jgi:hypothetical protein
VQPLGVRELSGERRLDLLVLDDPPLRGVDEEHPSRLEAALAHDGLGGEVEDAGLGGEDDQAVLGDPVAAGTQAVAVQDRPDEVPSVKVMHAGPSHGSIVKRVELVEGPAIRVHLLVVLPRLRDHHQHGVGQRSGRRGAGVRAPHRRTPSPTARAGRSGEAVQVAGDQVGLSWDSRAAIQLRLPLTVLISPLWAISR